MEKRLDRFIWKSMFLILPILFLPLFSNSVFAAHPLITDDTGTQGKGKFLLEVNSEVNYDKESEAGVKTKTTGGEVGTILSYGITENVDVVLVGDTVFSAWGYRMGFGNWDRGFG
jgi:hypothetical protein